jgi:hypothetical protein
MQYAHDTRHPSPCRRPGIQLVACAWMSMRLMSHRICTMLISTHILRTTFFKKIYITYDDPSLKPIEPGAWTTFDETLIIARKSLLIKCYRCAPPSEEQRSTTVQHYYYACMATRRRRLSLSSDVAVAHVLCRRRSSSPPDSMYIYIYIYMRLARPTHARQLADA